MINWVDISAFLITLPAIYLIGEKNRSCFVLFSISNFLLTYVAITNQLWGLLLLQITYFTFNVINWIKWGKKT